MGNCHRGDRRSIRPFRRVTGRLLVAMLFVIVGFQILISLSTLPSENTVKTELTSELFPRIKQNVSFDFSDNSEVMPDPLFRELYNTPVEYMKHRRQILLQKCHGEEEKYSGNVPLGYTQTFFSTLQKRNLALCKVAKAASTFWARLFYAEENNLTANPFEVDFRIIDNISRDESILTTKRWFFINAMETSRILVTRNPYSRIYSAYVDKVFAPNPYYWKVFGTQTIKHIRRNKTVLSRKCGHDVTFEEFLRYIIFYVETNRTLENHLLQIYESCKPCYFKYDVILKLETLKDDIRFLLQKINVSKYDGFLDTMSSRYEEDAIRDSINSCFEWRAAIQKCLSFEESLRRVWKKLQIRGMISREDTFPLSGEEARNISQENFMELVKGYSAKTRNGKRNRINALVKAYSAVPINVLKRLTKIYENDFVLFGYDPYPKMLFQRDDNGHQNFNPLPYVKSR